ncbi:MAG TPA: hypothetical protein VNC40_10815 [Gaiellaceae bacterium]|nr:hypothetical protein [Gaiellaceae bacterium]
MSYWLTMIGADDHQLEARPFDAGNRDELATEVRFPATEVPREFAVGDLLVYYAVGYHRIFAVARLDGPVVENVHHPEAEVQRRWPDAAPIQLLVQVDDLAFAPELKDIAPALLADIDTGASILPMDESDYELAEAELRRAQEIEQQRQRLIGGPVA